MSKKFISVLMGSDSDLSTVQSTLDTLNALAIPFEVKITSAHRTPDDTRPVSYTHLTLPTTPYV